MEVFCSKSDTTSESGHELTKLRTQTKVMKKLIFLVSKIFFLAGLFTFVAGTEVKGQVVPMRASDAKTTVNIGEFEQINLFDGKFSFNMALASVGGRGPGNGVFLTINPRWREAYIPLGSINGQPAGADVMIFDPYSKGKIKPNIGGYVIGQRHVLETHEDQFCWGPDEPVRAKTIAITISFNSFRGGSHTFRSIAGNGSPVTYDYNNSCYPPQVSLGGEFVSWDDSKVRFISDTAIPVTNEVEPYPFEVSGIIKLADGTTLRVDDGVVVSAADRNGNKTVNSFERITANNTSLASDATVHLSRVIDALGREITVENGGNVVYKGTGGIDRTVNIVMDSLADALRSGETLQTLAHLFPWSGAPQSCMTYPVSQYCTHPENVGVISRVDLPNGQSYRFFYNSYAEIARVELPTGAAIEYDYEFSAQQSTERRLKERRVYSGFSTLENRTEYIYSHYLSWSDPMPSAPWTSIRIKDPAGNVLSYTRHYFGGCVRYDLTPCLQQNAPSFYNADFYNALTLPSAGREITTEIYATDESTLLRKIERQYESRTSVYWGVLQGISVPIDHRISETKSTLVDSGQVSKMTFGYHGSVSYNLLTDVYEYGYGQDQPGSFIRRSHTVYELSSAYSNPAVNIMALRKENWVSSDEAGNAIVSRTKYEYDNYDSDANHAPLVNRSNITGHDSNYGTGYKYRGNVTAVTTYANAQSETGAITVHSQYDIAGNIVKTIDAKGNASIVDYSDRFGTPDGEARNNSAPSALNGQQTYAFVTSATNAAGYSTYAQFDYFTGANVDTENIIGSVSTTFYNDLLDRPTQAIAANNSSQFRKQTTIVYDDANRKVTVTADSKSFGDNLLKSEAFYDGLGRTFEARSYETPTEYVRTLTEYDALGRAYRSSTPHRPHLNEQPEWSESTFDALGRVIQIKTPDNAIVSRAYFGTTTTVTDQAGRKRTGISDAIGRLLKVIEDPTGAGYETTYTYDVLGRLRKTTQTEGQTTQNRYFMYDDLGRLIRAKQTEQAVNSNLNLTDPITGNSGWSVKYEYDPNGNITSTTDANNRTITGTYDALNRLTFRDYSDSTPDVTFTYDDEQIANSKGQLTAVTTSISSTYFTAFDALGRIKSSRQTTNGTNYDFPDYSYDFSGALVSQTYPSGRVVGTETDNIGRLSKVTGQLPGQVERTYLSNLAYTSFGAVKHARLGNGRWESAEFDPKRLQTEAIKLGGSAGDASLLKIEYDFGATDNNGSLRQQKITVPGAANPIIQDYTYDRLNRLKSATETVDAQITWKQRFDYDRFGNKRFDAANTTTLPQNDGVYNPQIDPETNKFLVAEGYNYDSDGNLLGNPENQLFTYDAENRQTQVQNLALQTTANYFYDGSGRRVRKIVEQEVTVFVYDAFGKLAAEYSTELSPEPKISYLTTDDLGSPRVVTDEFGQVVARHDYLPYGEEVMAGFGGRTTAQGYGGDDGVRQQFTGYERDDESGLDYAQARYFKPSHGRFTSVDPLAASANIKNPQTLNRYTYALNSPYKFTDPLGLAPVCTPGNYCTQGQESVEGDEARNRKPINWDTTFGAASAAAEAEYSEGVAASFDAARANAAIARGDQATAEAICARNGNLECQKSKPTVSVEAEVNTPSPDDVYFEPFVVSNAAALFSAVIAGTQDGFLDANGVAQCALLPLMWQNQQDGLLSPLGSRGRMTRKWVKGTNVSYGMNLKQGTVLASGWEGDSYLSNASGNHTVVFDRWGVENGKQGMYVAEQLPGIAKPVYSFKPFGDGNYVRNASAFHVVTFMRVRKVKPYE